MLFLTISSLFQKEGSLFSNPQKSDGYRIRYDIFFNRGKKTKDIYVLADILS